MDVTIKSFGVEMVVKNNGIEFEVRGPNGGDFIGDLIVTKTQLIWCEGKTARKNGKSISLSEFRDWMNQRP